MNYAHVIVVRPKDEPIKLYAHPAPDSQPILVPLAAWHVAAND